MHMKEIGAMFRKHISVVTLVLLIAVALGLSACAEPAGYAPAYVDDGYPPDWGWGGWWGGGWGHWDHAHGWEGHGWDHAHAAWGHGFAHGHGGVGGHAGVAGGGFHGGGGHGGGHGR